MYILRALDPHSLLGFWAGLSQCYRPVSKLAGSSRNESRDTSALARGVQFKVQTVQFQASCAIAGIRYPLSHHKHSFFQITLYVYSEICRLGRSLKVCSGADDVVDRHWLLGPDTKEESQGELPILKRVNCTPELVSYSQVRRTRPRTYMCVSSALVK